MPRIGLIADTHFGVANSKNFFLDYKREFFDKLKNDLMELGIDHLFHLGDLYETRKSINLKTLKETGEFFVKSFEDVPFQTHIIVGNHDAYNKNTLDINAPRELLSESKFKIYDSPQEIDINGTKIAIIPWMCNDNYDDSMILLDSTSAEICLGHFDISGFKFMNAGAVNTEGLSRRVFKKFIKTFSGHFHTPSDQDNIVYVGSPYQTSWKDYGDTKRVLVYDTETNEITEIQNNNDIFYKIHYTDENSKDLVKNLDIYKDKIVKVYTQGYYDSYSLDIFLNKLYTKNPNKVSVIESYDFSEAQTEKDIAEKDTLEFLVQYIEDNVDVDDHYKEELNKMMNRLYNEAQEVMA